MIRVAVVDDQTLVRQGLRSMLELAPDIEVVLEAEHGLAALEALPSVRPDVLLLDIRMPHLGGIDLLRRLQPTGAPPTLILTTFDDDEQLLSAVEAGARGYLLKDAGVEVLLRAIRELAGGGRWLQPVVTTRAAQQLGRVQGQLQARQERMRDEITALSVREAEVLRLIAGGYSNREIAGALGTTEGTIKGYVSSVLSKLHSRDRTRAVLRGLELGLL